MGAVRIYQLPRSVRSLILPVDLNNQLNDFQKHILAVIQHHTTGINLPSLLLLLSKIKKVNLNDKQKRRNLYQKIYWTIKYLKQKELISIIKENDGMLWLYPKHLFFDLINPLAKFKPDNQTPKNPFKIPSRCSHERLDNIRTILQTDIVDSVRKEHMQENFYNYLLRTSRLYLILRKKQHYINSSNISKNNQNKPRNDDDNDLIGIQYSTRFSDNKKKKKLLDKYHRIIQRSLQKYNTGVFLTLTTDPKIHKSLWHSTRHIGVALNKFFSYLNSRFYKNHPGYKNIKKAMKQGLISHQKGKQELARIRKETRPVYVACYEFTETGLCHVHILIFGKSFLMPKDDITKEWQRCQQGTVNWIYRIRKTPKGWQWHRKKPPGCKKTKTADQYLAKYLKKALFDTSSLFMYFTTNKRFYTYSRVLFPPNPVKTENIARYEFIGAFDEDQVPLDIITIIYYRSTPKNLFTFPPPIT